MIFAFKLFRDACKWMGNLRWDVENSGGKFDILQFSKTNVQFSNHIIVSETSKQYHKFHGIQQHA